MAQIPFPDGYKPKKQTSKKQKKTKLKRGKSKAVSPSLNEKLSSDVEKKEPAQKFYDDIVWGDVKAPTKYDKFIVTGKIDEVEVYEKTLTAQLAKASTYICWQIRKWYEEEIVGDIAEWYKKWYKNPFTSRLEVIEMPYKDADYILTYMNMTALRDNLKDGYKEMFRVANQCDRERIDYHGDLPTYPIRDFKAAAAKFYEVVNAICIKSNAELKKLTKPARNPDGSVAKHDYKWQSVLLKVEDYWKKFKKGERENGIAAKDIRFPSIRSIAEDIKENWSTTKKAIQYSRSLSRAYNKSKPDKKKLKFIDPSKLSHVGKKGGRHRGNVKAERDEIKSLKRDIKKLAQKYKGKTMPEISGLGGFLTLEKMAVAVDNLDDLGVLRKIYAAVKEIGDNYEAEMIANFNRDRLI